MDHSVKKVAECYLESQMTVGMVAAVTATGFLIGARDRLDRKAQTVEMWVPLVKRTLGRVVPFSLHRLKNVPLDLAERLADVGTAASTFPSGRIAWQAAKRYAEPKAFAHAD